ncbi:uncharacterized protein LOC120777130 [Bactrocera tryoni]|uniref:uncharacterized protein LOC120777130 n=1 Tax=Bactrocera tryoni TaxID=59916 RepID=UPI001A997AB0|nr:uncharacterized protein LOC120777130 [Bactrocera tryoni]
MESPLLKRKTGKNFTRQEEDALVELVDEQRHVLENKRSDAVTWKQKEEGPFPIFGVGSCPVIVLKRCRRSSDCTDEHTCDTAALAKLFILAIQWYWQNFDTSTPEREKFIVHTEDITDADELNQENVKNVDHEEEQWSSWTPNALRSKKTSKLLIDCPGTRKRNLEEEKIKLTVLQQQFYADENTRAQEKHEQELIALKLENELMQLEILKKKPN